MNIEDIKDIVSKYYKNVKSGIYIKNYDMSYCFCGEIFAGSGACPKCKKKSRHKAETGSSMRRRTDIIYDEDTKKLAIKDMRLYPYINGNELSLNEQYENYIAIGEDGASARLYEKIAKGFDDKAKSAIRTYKPIYAELLGERMFQKFDDYNFVNKLNNSYQIVKNYPYLLESKNMLDPHIGLEIVSYSRGRTREEYFNNTEGKKTHEILRIHEGFLPIASYYTINELVTATQNIDNEKAKDIAQYIVQNFADSRYIIEKAIKVLTNKDYNIDLKRFIELSEKSSRYFDRDDSFHSVIEKYFETYKKIYGEYPSLDYDKAITNKEYGRLLSQSEMIRRYKVSVKDSEIILNTSMTDPMKALKILKRKIISSVDEREIA